MKKSVSLFLCILCCLFPLSACSQPEKSIEDHVNLALEQFGKPLGEAFEGMKLPGSLEEAAKPNTACWWRTLSMFSENRVTWRFFIWGGMRKARN